MKPKMFNERERYYCIEPPPKTCSLLNNKKFNIGAIEEFFSTYMIWAEPEQVIALVQDAYMKAKDVDGTREFHIVVQDKGWTYRIGCRFFILDGVRIGVLFPYVYNVPVANITGDDWETTVYHEELEA